MIDLYEYDDVLSNTVEGLHRQRRRLELEISSTDLAIQTLNLISQKKAKALERILLHLKVVHNQAS